MKIRRTREKGKYEGREKAIAQDRKVQFSSVQFSSIKLVNKEFI